MPPAQAEVRTLRSPVPDTVQTPAQMQAETPALAERSPTVFVPEIGTTTIIRGDSLWQISRRIYGKGTRYTVIFDANQPQIRNPDLIYPGQIFVLPTDGTAAVPQSDKRG
jgi:nucleoid-associated protein YgaU